MTDQPQQLSQVPPFDPGNPLLSIGPVSLTVSAQPTPQGQKLCATIRTIDTTLTVFLSADEVDDWVNVLKTGRGQLHGLIVPA